MVLLLFRGKSGLSHQVNDQVIWQARFFPLRFQFQNSFDLKLGAVVGQKVFGACHSLIGQMVEKVRSRATGADVNRSLDSLAFQLGLNGLQLGGFTCACMAGDDLYLHGVSPFSVDSGQTLAVKKTACARVYGGTSGTVKSGMALRPGLRGF